MLQDNRSRILVAMLLLVIFALLMALIAVAGRPGAATPTQDPNPIRTDAVRTFSADLTATSFVLPTSTPSRTPTQTTVAVVAGSGTPNCLGLSFVRDVTIPDNTEMTPAEVFTKSWLVRNSGTCAWKAGYQVVLVGGLAMGGSPFRVAQTVGPGGEIQVSIKMAAPTNQTGIVQGTWMMTDDQGIHFGDYLSVVLVIAGPTRIPGSTTVPSATP